MPKTELTKEFIAILGALKVYCSSKECEHCLFAREECKDCDEFEECEGGCNMGHAIDLIMNIAHKELGHDC